MALLAGCGTQAEQPAGNQTIEVELGAPPTQAPVLNAEDLPTQAGSRMDYLANMPGTGTSVVFNLSGPWNFAAGPSDASLTIVTIEAAVAPGEDFFPEANVAAQSSWSPATVAEEYNFQDKDGSSWRSYGKFGPDGRLRTYSTGVRALIFPAAIGSAWTEAYSEIESGRTINIRAENQVVARNRLTVPAGTFEAFLLQTRVTSTSDGRSSVVWDYTWFVPGIGRAAEIISLPDESDEVFGNASSFYRLESYRIP